MRDCCFRDVPSRSGTAAGGLICPTDASAGRGGSSSVSRRHPAHTRVRGYSIFGPACRALYGRYETANISSHWPKGHRRVYNGPITARSRNDYCRSARTFFDCTNISAAVHNSDPNHGHFVTWATDFAVYQCRRFLVSRTPPRRSDLTSFTTSHGLTPLGRPNTQLHNVFEGEQASSHLAARAHPGDGRQHEGRPSPALRRSPTKIRGWPRVHIRFATAESARGSIRQIDTAATEYEIAPSAQCASHLMREFAAE